MPATLTVFDLEFTAWECSMASHWLRPGEFKEVVQIGAVRLDSASFAILDEFDVLVRPRINPVLSPYFEKLTGISNALLAEKGVDFAQAYARFAAFTGGDPICAFGHDEGILDENIRLYDLKGADALPRFFDLRDWFAENSLDPRGMLSCEIAAALGATFQGHAHNALNDARSLAQSMDILRTRGATAILRPAA